MPRTADDAASRPLLRRLARRRVALGFLAGAVAFVLAEPTSRSLVAGGAVALVGEAIRLWAAGHLDKGREVTMSGPYRLVRHPLYLGSCLLGIGLAIASAHLGVAALVTVYLGTTLLAAVTTEESTLEHAFGPTYAAYREGRLRDSERGFSLERVRANREYRALAGLFVGITLLCFKAWLR